ncbi:hypothetical protein IFR05_002313 [Cadophora sp. M221]|nr:hypothetical protein IFR05_002313 [Cadophora sp. M221]
METVTNIASAASRAIWGEGTNPEDKKDVNGNATLGKEPVAGELGDVKSGEPYDKGNVEVDASGELPLVLRKIWVQFHILLCKRSYYRDTYLTCPLTDETTTHPAKSTLTSNPKPAATETTSDPSAGAVLLPESPNTTRDTPTNLLATSDKPSTANEKAAKLPSETTDSEALTFTKSDPAADKTKIGTESLEEKASGVKGTTGFDTPEPAAATTTTTGTSAVKSEGLREETVGSNGLLEEKRVNPESASEPKIGETSTSKISSASASSPKKSLDGAGSGDGEGEGKEKKSLKEKIKEKLHRHKD